MCIIIFYIGKEHWIGLDNIYKLTNRKNVKTQLRIDLETNLATDPILTVTYDDFHLKDQVMCTTFAYCMMNITIFTQPLVTFHYIILISDLL